MMVIEIDFLIIIATGQVRGACGQQSLFYTGSEAEKIAQKPKLDMEKSEAFCARYFDDCINDADQCGSYMANISFSCYHTSETPCDRNRCVSALSGFFFGAHAQENNFRYTKPHFECCPSAHSCKGMNEQYAPWECLGKNHTFYSCTDVYTDCLRIPDCKEQYIKLNVACPIEIFWNMECPKDINETCLDILETTQGWYCSCDFTKMKKREEKLKCRVQQSIFTHNDCVFKSELSKGKSLQYQKDGTIFLKLGGGVCGFVLVFLSFYALIVHLLRNERTRKRKQKIARIAKTLSHNRYSESVRFEASLKESFELNS
jgi:hypothetical protein